MALPLCLGRCGFVWACPGPKTPLHTHTHRGTLVQGWSRDQKYQAKGVPTLDFFLRHLGWRGGCPQSLVEHRQERALVQRQFPHSGWLNRKNNKIPVGCQHYWAQILCNSRRLILKEKESQGQFSLHVAMPTLPWWQHRQKHYPPVNELIAHKKQLWYQGSKHRNTQPGERSPKKYAMNLEPIQILGGTRCLIYSKTSFSHSGDREIPAKKKRRKV